MFKNNQIIQNLWYNLDEPVLVIDKDNRIILWSKGCEREFGYDVKEVISRGKWNFLFASGKELKPIMNEMNSLLDKGFQVKLKNKKRDEFIAKLQVKAMTIDGDQDLYFLINIQNITHQKVILRELQQVKLVVKEKNMAVARATELLKQKEKLLLSNMTEMKRLYQKVKKSEAELKRKTIELQEKVRELNRFNKLMIGREMKMVELKKQIKKLKGNVSKKG